MDFSRRNFIKGSAAITGSVALSSCASGISSQPTKNMCGFSAPKIDKVRVGIVGLGMRGGGAVSRLSKIADVEVVALCDIRETHVKKSQGRLKKNGRKPAKEFFGDVNAFKKMCELDLDLVYCCTSWDYHTPISVYAMEHGSHSATEVPAGKTIDELWQLVEVSERTGKHCMMLENCCYDFYEMGTLNMVRNGVFGELTHAEGAYIHTLCGLLQNKNAYYKQWRMKENEAADGNLYPTHGLGPVAQCMNINRGNKFDYIVSMSSQEAAWSEFSRQKKRQEYVDIKYRGDMSTSIIKTAKGQTIMVQHDVSTPRPYSRIHMMQGSRGMCSKWPSGEFALMNNHGGHRWLSKEDKAELQEKYAHPLNKTMGDMARKVGGHGGMDFIMDYRLIYCIKHGLPLDQDVYDAASWSAVMPLSIESVSKRSTSIDVPDFTRGNWKKNAPLGIVNVDPSKLKMFNKDAADGQLNVH